MASNILTNEEVKEIICVDDDFPSSKVLMLNNQATSFLDHKTNRNWEKDSPIVPLAKAAASLVIKRNFNDDEAFDKPINDYVEDLKDYIRVELANVKATS